MTEEESEVEIEPTSFNNQITTWKIFKSWVLIGDEEEYYLSDAQEKSIDKKANKAEMIGKKFKLNNFEQTFSDLQDRDLFLLVYNFTTGPEGLPKGLKTAVTKAGLNLEEED